MVERRDRMSPGAGKMLKADGTVLDVAAVLAAVYDSGAGAIKTSGGSGATEVDANLQVGDAAVANANPVPISDAGGSVTVDGTVEANDTPRAFATGKTHTPAADTAAVVTLAAAGASVSNVIRGIAWGYSEAPTGGSLKIEDGAGTTVFYLPITAAGPGFIPVFGKGSANTALVVTLAAGGGTCVGSVNVLEAWTE